MSFSNEVKNLGGVIVLFVAVLRSFATLKDDTKTARLDSAINYNLTLYNQVWTESTNTSSLLLLTSYFNYNLYVS